MVPGSRCRVVSPLLTGLHGVGEHSGGSYLPSKPRPLPVHPHPLAFAIHVVMNLKSKHSYWCILNTDALYGHKQNFVSQVWTIWVMNEARHRILLCVSNSKRNKPVLVLTLLCSSDGQCVPEQEMLSADDKMRVEWPFPHFLPEISNLLLFVGLLVLSPWTSLSL